MRQIIDIWYFDDITASPYESLIGTQLFPVTSQNPEIVLIALND